jgi:glycosyltransferase involved in cell wall biosynthesis
VRQGSAGTWMLARAALLGLAGAAIVRVHEPPRAFSVSLASNRRLVKHGESVAFQATIADAATTQLPWPPGNTLPLPFRLRVVPLEQDDAPPLYSDSTDFSLLAQTPDLGCVQVQLVLLRQARELAVSLPVSKCWVASSSYGARDALLPRIEALVRELQGLPPVAPRARSKAVIFSQTAKYDGMARMLIWQIEALKSQPQAPVDIDLIDTSCRLQDQPWLPLTEPLEPASRAIHPDRAQALRHSGEFGRLPVFVREALVAGARVVWTCLSLAPGSFPGAHAEGFHRLRTVALPSAQSLGHLTGLMSGQTEWLTVVLHPLLDLLRETHVAIQANSGAFFEDMHLMHAVRLASPSAQRVLALGAWPLVDPRFLSLDSAQRLVRKFGVDAAGFDTWRVQGSRILSGLRSEPPPLGFSLEAGTWAIADSDTERVASAFLSSAASAAIPVTLLQAPSLHVLDLPGVGDGSSGARGILISTSVDAARHLNPSQTAPFEPIQQIIAERVRSMVCVSLLPSRIDRTAFCGESDVSRAVEHVRRRGDVVVFLFSGRLSAVKGVGTLLQAIRSVTQHLVSPAMPLPVFLFVSQPPRKTGGSLSALTLEDAVNAFVSELSIASWVSFHPYIAPTDVPSLLATVDVVLSPFLNHISETLGLAALEALAMGKVVVHCGVGGMRDFMTDSRQISVVVRPGCTPRSLSTALGKVLQLTPAQRAVLGDAARNTTLGSFSHQVWFRQLWRWYLPE